METATNNVTLMGNSLGINLQENRYCLYARKSTEQDELQALSIESQIKEMLEMANKENLNVIEIRRESHSAKDSGMRPVFEQLLIDVRSGMFNGIIAWDPSRISRNAGDLGKVVDLMDQGYLADIRTHGQRFTNSPNEKFLLMILCSQAKLENDHKGENVKRGLRAKCDLGFRPGVPPLGYIHDRYALKGEKKVFLDKDRAPYIREMFEKVAYQNASGRDIYNWFIENKVYSKGNKRISLSTIFRMLKDTYYYGEFEYPIGSGKIYQGQYDPIITKELFLKAKANIISAPNRKHPGTNEFNFTRIFHCAHCGSSITAEEKFKTNKKDGKIHKYIYYHCCKSADRNCKYIAIREENLILQLQEIIDKVDINRIGALDQIKREIIKYKQFSYSVFGKKNELEDIVETQADIRNYAKHILNHGTKDQKREILGLIASEIKLKDGNVYLEIGGKN